MDDDGDDLAAAPAADAGERASDRCGRGDRGSTLQIALPSGVDPTSLVGATVTGNDVAAGTTVTGYSSTSGGTSTYTVNNYSLVGSTPLTLTPPPVTTTQQLSGVVGNAAMSGAGANPASNPGLMRWFGVLRTLPLPADADAACTELTAATDDLEARVVAILGGVTRYWESSKATAEALKIMDRAGWK